eukprot:TRINITY_DN38281_c0_g1_i1.p1 TRINITY_DN38281_c0_g1~~TRINITY_DN38281_c0_g1_i1.p1  ORF type:complete len:275 (+),score=43.49 TRINITY_DN38281_c0_g1_i1:39-863(+)
MKDDLTLDEKAMFEDWLEKGVGRIRLVTPPTHSSYKIGPGVLLNVGTHGLVEGGDLLNMAIHDIPFQVAPLRDGTHKGTSVLILDVVVNPKTVAADNCIHYLRQLIYSIGATATSEYPSLYEKGGQYPAGDIQRLDPLPIAPLTLEITNAHFKKGFDVMRRAHAQQLRHQKNVSIRPVAVHSYPFTANLEVPVNSLTAAWDVTSGAVTVTSGDVSFLTISVDTSIDADCCKAFIIKKSNGRFLLRIKEFRDEIDVRALDLQNKISAARKRRIPR